MQFRKRLMSMASLKVKLNNEFRRVDLSSYLPQDREVPYGAITNLITVKFLLDKCSSVYSPLLNGKQVILSWIDPAGDEIKFSTDEELQDALKYKFHKSPANCTFEFNIELAPVPNATSCVVVPTSEGQLATDKTVPIVASTLTVRKEFPIFNYSDHVQRGQNSFPDNNIGKTLFPRKALSRDIIANIDHLVTKGEKGYYICGPRASGKTTLLRCLAKTLQDRGEKVYYVTNAVLLDKEYTIDDVKAMEAALPPGRTQYIFVDDIQNDKSGALLNYLLKESQKSFTIGFGLSKYTGLEFQAKHPPDGLALTSNDITSDEEVIRPYFSSLAPKLTQKQVDDMLNWLWLHTGGLLFPFVKLCYHFLNDAQFVEEYSKDDDVNMFLNRAMRIIFQSEDGVYSRIVSRCFTDTTARAGKQLMKTGYKDKDAATTLCESGLMDFANTGSLLVCPYLETYILNAKHLKNI